MQQEQITIQQIQDVLKKAEERRQGLIQELRELDNVLKTKSFTAGSEIPVPFRKSRRGRPAVVAEPTISAGAGAAATLTGRAKEVYQLLKAAFPKGLTKAELADKLKTKKQNTNYPIDKILLPARLVSTERDGREIRYFAV